MLLHSDEQLVGGPPLIGQQVLVALTSPRPGSLAATSLVVSPGTSGAADEVMAAMVKEAAYAAMVKKAAEDAAVAERAAVDKRAVDAERCKGEGCKQHGGDGGDYRRGSFLGRI
jgi:hypothetical protein